MAGTERADAVHILSAFSVTEVPYRAFHRKERNEIEREQLIIRKKFATKLPSRIIKH
jgi:hypothetical protein